MTRLAQAGRWPGVGAGVGRWPGEGAGVVVGLDLGATGGIYRDIADGEGVLKVVVGLSESVDEDASVIFVCAGGDGGAGVQVCDCRSIILHSVSSNPSFGSD